MLGVRLARSSDSRMVWRLNNGPGVRAVSQNTGEIPWADHVEWFAQRLRDRHSLMLVFEDDHGPIGVVRFDGVGDDAKVSIVVEPACRGRGMGRRILASGVEYLLDFFGGRIVEAKILETNEASRKCFEAAGFARNGRAGKWLRYRYSRPRSATAATP